MGRAKARLELGGRSFVVRGVELLRAGGCARVIVVDGAHRLAPEELAGAELAHASEWRAGPLASVQAGLGRALELEPELAGLVVHHVERPRVAPDTVRALLEGLGREPACVWQPSYRGRSGHPLVWPRACLPALAALDPRQHSARDLVRSPRVTRRKLQLDDPGVVDNIDTPAALAELTRAWQN